MTELLVGRYAPGIRPVWETNMFGVTSSSWRYEVGTRLSRDDRAALSIVFE